MYENRSPKQRNGLIYGCRKRSIGALKGIVGNYRHQEDINPFTQAEMDAIERICQDAGHRAKETFERTQAELADAEASGRPEAELRQYTGK